MNAPVAPQWPAGTAPSPAFCGEDERLSVLAAFGVDALQDDPELAEITAFAAQLCDAPICLVSLVEQERQRFIARTGLDALETPRPTSFCAHAMLGSEALQVPDAQADPRFADNPLVTGEPHIRFYAGAPLISSEGAPLGALCVIDRVPRAEGLTSLQTEGLAVLARAVMRRLLERRGVLASERERKSRDLTLRSLADAIPDIVWSIDRQGQFDFVSNRWQEFTGNPPPASPADFASLMHAEDQDSFVAAWQAARAGGAPLNGEYRLRHRDGSWRWMAARALPTMPGQGGTTQWFGTLADIDEAHRAAEGRELLSRELAHRIKNIFAVVGSLISLRGRAHPEAAPFVAEISETIGALGRAHDYVQPGTVDEGGAPGGALAGLLQALLKPYMRAGTSQVTITGAADCAVGRRAATPIALVFHELATNATKYGALSVTGGSVTVDVGRDDDGVRISWREQGGPPVAPPEREGFGSRLARMSVEGQLGGKLERRFEASGLEVDVTIPAATLAA